MSRIRVAIVGIGNCTSSLVQGIHFYRDNFPPGTSGEEVIGLAHPDLGGYGVGDIDVVAAIDIDRRKIGRPLKEAVFAKPNCTKVFYDQINDGGVTVRMGRVLDGIAQHMGQYAEDRRFIVADEPEADQEDIEQLLRDSGAEILMNYLPVGSQQATEFYAECCLNTGVSFINCIPVFIVSNPSWSRRFTEAGICCVGDDIKAQVGATISHRVLAKMMADRGATIDATYQLNTGGNTDFLNMLDQSRLGSKRESKTEAVQSQLHVPLPPDQVHIGPADYVPWQNDNKVCFLRLEARGFGGVPLNLEARLSVEDSPNSAGETIDAIRACKLGRDRGLAGPLEAISAFTMKHPPVQFSDGEARRRLDRFIAGESEAPDGTYEPADESARAPAAK
ncbi:MAG: inositol-3-phosphate synthase [Phycisphaerae bacterium]|nr:inositol-3-phosphate synthase [Phycisphaerae bacterium]